MKRAFLAAALGAALFSNSPKASANGRFPQSNQIVFSAADPDLVILRVTFGLLVSHDRGKTFSHVCELSIGTTQNEDPMYAVTPSKAILGTTFEGVAASRDEACSWSFVTDGLLPDGKAEVFIDLASDPADGKNVFVLSSAYDTQVDGQLLFKSHVFATTNEGQSFSLVGQKLDPTLLGYTLDLTKTDPNRIYLSATRSPGPNPTGYLLVSNDRGKTWAEETIPLVNKEQSPFIAAVDPNDSERVYVRTLPGQDSPQTRLLLREKGVDGGPGVWRVLHTASGPLTGFALSPDGSKVWIGSQKDGLLEASTSDFVFTQKSKIEVGCLGVSSDGLWACSSEISGFALGLSKDEGATFEARLHFCDVKGELECPVTSTTTRACVLSDAAAPAWPTQRINLGCESDAGTLTPFDGGAPTPAAPGGSGSDGCNCNVPAAPPWGTIGVGIAGAAMAIAAARRGRRRR